MCDLEVRHPSHNFALGNGIVSSNSHATAYSALSTAQLWLKHHYPEEFVCALIDNTRQSKKKHGSDNVLVSYINYARRRGIKVLGPDVSRSGVSFKPEGGSIRFSLRHVKFVASAAEVIQSCQPFGGMEDFNAKAKVNGRRLNKKVVESLIAAGAFDAFGSRNEMSVRHYELRKALKGKSFKEDPPPQRSDDEWAELEKEAIGMCLSVPPLRETCEELVAKCKWRFIGDAGDLKKPMVLGKVEDIASRTSTAGNSMLVVRISDRVDDMKFFVFKSAMDFFSDNVKVGMVAAFPLSKFEGSDMWFFDDRRACEVLEGVR